MIDAHTIRHDLNALITCAPLDCPLEGSCFRVARALLALLPEPVRDESEPDPDAVAHYAPDWSRA